MYIVLRKTLIRIRNTGGIVTLPVEEHNIIITQPFVFVFTFEWNP